MRPRWSGWRLPAAARKSPRGFWAGLPRWKSTREAASLRRRGKVVYEHALRLTDATNEAGRDELLVRLVLASFNAGRPEVTVQWADRKPSPWRLPRPSFTGCTAWLESLARIWGVSTSRSIIASLNELAVVQEDADKISDCLAALADVHRRRGELDRAETLCLKAESLRPGQCELPL